jgi:molybdopterin synthase sulfur carrier subunit
MPIVWIPSLLRSLTDGKETVTVEGETVGQVIDNLEQHYPGIRARLYQGDRLRPNLSLLVDGTLSTRGLLQKLSGESEVRFIPAIRGGNASSISKPCKIKV